MRLFGWFRSKPEAGPKHQRIFGECECDQCAPVRPVRRSTRSAPTVVSGDPSSPLMPFLAGMAVANMTREVEYPPNAAQDIQAGGGDFGGGGASADYGSSDSGSSYSSDSGSSSCGSSDSGGSY